jgi:hypothetical protein
MVNHNGIAREHRIPLKKIRCMTDKCYERVKKIWQGVGGKPPPAPDLKKIGPRSTITVFPRAGHESIGLL